MDQWLHSAALLTLGVDVDADGIDKAAVNNLDGNAWCLFTVSTSTGGVVTSQIPGSSSRIRSSSILYPISNSSVISTTSSPTSTTSTGTALVAPLTGCAVVSALLVYDPARSYCSSAYPQVVLTSFVDTTTTNVVTTLGPASTVISNVTIPFSTTVETVQTFTTTTSYVPTLLTSTDTFTLM